MRKSIPTFAALRAFEAFARLGGVRKAATALEIDHSAVSRHLKSLQEWLGIELVSRGGGRHHLTPAGEQYYREVCVALKTLVDAAQGLRAGDRARLSFHCSPGFAFKWLTRHIANFQKLAPDTEIDLRPTDRPADFARENVSGDIRYVTAMAESGFRGLKHIEFARPPVYPVASPAYLAARGGFASIESLKRADLLHEDSADDWGDWFRALGHPSTTQLPGDRLWHAHVTIEAAIHGRGMALANDFLVKDDLASGVLVKVTVADTGDTPETTLGGYCFFTTETRWGSPIIGLFRRWLQDEVRREAIR